jgi:hypothetical protein
LPTGPVSPGHAITREEQRVIDLFQKEKMIIEATTAIAAIGIRSIGEIHQHASQTFDETVGFILEVKAQPREREHQLYVEEFSKHQIQMLARHLYGAVEVASTNIGMEMHRSFYLPPEQPGFWGRLLGR